MTFNFKPIDDDNYSEFCDLVDLWYDDIGIPNLDKILIEPHQSQIIEVAKKLLEDFREQSQKHLDNYHDDRG